MERFDNLSSWNIGFKGQEAFFRYRESGNLSPKNAGFALVISHTGLLAAVCFIPEQEHVFDNLWNKAILAEERREEQSATKRRY